MRRLIHTLAQATRPVGASLTILMLTVTFAGILSAQTPTGPAATGTVSMDDYKALHKKRAERAMLQRIIASMNIVDSVYIVHYPTWIIRDEDIRQRVFKTFRNRLKFPSRDSDLVVVTTPEKDEIVRIAMGSVSMGREETRLYIGDNLRHAILEKEYPRMELEPEIGRRHRPVTDQEMENVLFEGSLFGARLLFPSGWGGMVRIGNDDLGYPFWAAGSMEMFLTLDRLKVGATLPIASGLGGADIVGPVSIQGRKLNGVPGFALEYTQPIGTGNFTIHFQSNNPGHVDSTTQFTNPDQVYYLRSMVQGYYQQHLAIMNGEHNFTVGIGLGFHQIGLGQLQPNNELGTIDRFNNISPLVKIDYSRVGSKTYGIGLQLYSRNMMITTWLEFVKDFIYADVKYSTPVFRGANPWENSYFIMFSPRIRLAF